MHGHLALDKLLKEYEFSTVLDIGSGMGKQAAKFRNAGKRVTTVSLMDNADYVGDFMCMPVSQTWDVVWACHVLEHQRNAGAFLERCYMCLADNGVLAITVPPRKDNIVGGHVCIWNAGLLLYNLILAGFDCSQAKVKMYDYNISVIVRKRRAELRGLRMNGTDLDLLAHYFPMPVKQGFNGNFTGVNW